MLTVWSVLNGSKYRDEDVRILRRQVARHLHAEHRFRCLSDREIPGVDCVILPDRWPGWWAKLQLFAVESGPALYLDLDCVVVGALDYLLCSTLSLPANWAQSGYGGCQSSVMAWSGDQSWLIRDFDPARIGPASDEHCGLYGVEQLWGDQEWITSVAGWDRAIRMPGVCSYKYHCGGGHPPQGARVVAFHGRPKPDEVRDEWVRLARM